MMFETCSLLAKIFSLVVHHSDVALSQTEMENITDHFDPDGDGCINISEMDSILSGLHTEQPLTKPSASKCNKRDCEVRSFNFVL